MKKLVYLLITLSVLIILSACVKISVTPPDSDIKNNIPQTSSVDTTSSAENTDAKDTEKIEAPVTTKAPETTKTPETAKSDYDFPTQSGNEALTRVTVSERVMVDENGVKITLKGIDFDKSSSPQLKFAIENNTDQDFQVSTGDILVNNYMINTGLYTTVSAGKKSTDYISLFKDQLQLCNISTIATLDMAFEVYNDYNTILTTDFMKIETSAAENFIYTYNDSGTLIYEKNNIKVVAKYLYKKSSYYDSPSLLLYIHNNSNRYISLNTRDLSINGYMVSSSLYTNILPNAHAVSDISFSSGDLEENDITTIENLEFKLYIYDKVTYKTIDESEVIYLNANDLTYEKNVTSSNKVSSNQSPSGTSSESSSFNNNVLSKEQLNNETTQISTVSLPPKTGKQVEYSTPDFPGIIKVDSSYNVYSTTNDYTEEMCKAQGTDKAEMYLYMYVSGIEMAIYPYDALFDEPYFEIKIDVIADKDDNEITIDNLNNFSNIELELVWITIIKQFEEAGYKPINGEKIQGDIYRTDQELFFVFDCMRLYQERIYITIINDTFIIFTVSSQGQQITPEQDNVVKEIIESLSY